MAYFLVYCSGPLGAWKYIQQSENIVFAENTVKATGAKVIRIHEISAEEALKEMPQPCLSKEVIQFATLDDFVRGFFSSSEIEDIAIESINRKLGSSLKERISGIDRLLFYERYRTEIDRFIEDSFYYAFVGKPESWFALAKDYGYDIIHLDQAREFYVEYAIEFVACRIALESND